MKSIVHCPSCRSEYVVPVLNVEDHTVSHEFFEILSCNNCKLRFTNSIPAEDQIGRYYQSEQYISHTDSNNGLFNKTYQFVRSHALRSKRNLVENFSLTNAGYILDYGCGTGAFLNEMKLSGWNVMGIEPDPGAMNKAIVLTGVDVKPPSALAEFKAKSFDAITLWHVLEHVHELHATIDKLKDALKLGGYLFVAVPNYTSYDATVYKEYWAAYDVPRHLYHFSPNSMKQLMQSHGLSLKRTMPMWFDSFYVSLLSEKYKNKNISFIYALITGTISNLKAFFNRDSCSSLIYVLQK